MTHLKNVFPIYAQMISGEVGVDVVIGGNRAFFDGATRTINLPALDLNDEELAEAAWGYQYHESFHASDSNMDIVANITDPLRKKTVKNY
jgi:antirestriction protein ArdC